MRKTLLFTIVILIFSLVFASCEPPIAESSMDNESLEEVVSTASSEEPQNESSTSYSTEARYLSYEEFIIDFPEFIGRWRLSYDYFDDMYLTNDYENVVEYIPGQILEFTSIGIKLLDIDYIPKENWFFVYKDTKNGICSSYKLKEYDEVPLSDSVVYDYFRCLADSNNDSDLFESGDCIFDFCIYDGDKLFIHIDSVAFTAERVE